MMKVYTNISKEWNDLIKLKKIQLGNFAEVDRQRLFELLEPGDLLYTNTFGYKSARAVTFLKLNKDPNVVLQTKVWDPEDGDRYYSVFELMKVELDPSKERCTVQIWTPPSKTKSSFVEPGGMAFRYKADLHIALPSFEPADPVFKIAKYRSRETRLHKQATVNHQLPLEVQTEEKKEEDESTS